MRRYPSTQSKQTGRVLIRHLSRLTALILMTAMPAMAQQTADTVIQVTVQQASLIRQNQRLTSKSAPQGQGVFVISAGDPATALAITHSGSSLSGFTLTTDQTGSATFAIEGSQPTEKENGTPHASANDEECAVTVNY